MLCSLPPCAPLPCVLLPHSPAALGTADRAPALTEPRAALGGPGRRAVSRAGCVPRPCGAARCGAERCGLRTMAHAGAGGCCCRRYSLLWIALLQRSVTLGFPKGERNVREHPRARTPGRAGGRAGCPPPPPLPGPFRLRGSPRAEPSRGKNCSSEAFCKKI